MIKWTYILLFHVTIFTSKNVLADCSEISCNGIGEQVVKSVYVTNKPDGVVYLQAPIGKEKLKCNLVEGDFMTLKKSHPLFKETYSLILTALSSNKHFYVRIVDNSDICEVLYVRMYN